MNPLPLLAMLLLLALAGNSEAPHKYLLVYTVPVLNPYAQTLMVCSTPGCNNVYSQEERHEWFESLNLALDRMNGLTGTFTQGSNGAWVTNSTPMKAETIIGLFEVKQIPVTLQKIGTQKALVMKTVEEEVPDLRWKIQP